MKITVTRPVQLEVAAIQCILPVNYGEEDIPLDFPGRQGDVLTLTLDLHTKKIRGWKGGAKRIHMKVVDQGEYLLQGLQGETIASIEQGYVPDCIPNKYRDYVVFEIDPDGTLIGWRPDAEEVADAFFPHEED